MSMLSVRSARIDDLDAIMALEENGFPRAICESRDVMRRRLQHFTDGFLVLEDSAGKPIGYLCSELWTRDDPDPVTHFSLGHDILHTHRHDGTHLYISSMTIDPSCRGNGLGNRFFVQSIALLRARLPRLRSSLLLLSAEWISAHRIYMACGYSEIARLPDFFASVATRDADAIVMQLSFSMPQS